jgi:membrane-associated phospholipid phosphatase
MNENNNNTLSDSIAKIISIIFDPAALGILILVVAIIRSHMPSFETIGWIISVIVLNGIVPLIFLVYFYRKGYVFDDVLQKKDVHKQRVRLYYVFLTVVAIELIYLYFTIHYQPLYAVLTGGFVAIVIALAITYFWKISLHSSIVTLFVAMLLFIYGSKVAVVIAFIPLVFWSRIVLKRHTFGQLFAGFILALIIAVGIFYMFGLV